jgi:hypothetical protein
METGVAARRLISTSIASTSAGASRCTDQPARVEEDQDRRHD